MSARFGRHFADMWGAIPADDMKAVWADDLAGFSGDEIRRGLDGCKGLKFPPTLPEFLQLCRPPPDYQVAYHEAVRELLKRRQPFDRFGNVKTNLDQWSHPSIYWAASTMEHALLNLPYPSMKERWKKALDDALAEGRTDVPPWRPALPEPGKIGMLPEEWQKKVAELTAKLRLGKTGGAA
jgi:hypothetical protein